MAFTPRLNDSGMMNNPYWYSGNPFYRYGYGLPNCTCYCWGRWKELFVQNNVSSDPTLSLGNGTDWYGYTQDGYQRGQTPKLGAVICYADTGGGAGHVAVVEEIDANGNITCSNSAYNGQYFFITHSTRANNYEDGYTYVGSGQPIFQGFIYNPYTGDGPTPPEPPTPTPTGANKKIWLSKRIWLRKRGLVWL